MPPRTTVQRPLDPFSIRLDFIRLGERLAMDRGKMSGERYTRREKNRLRNLTCILGGGVAGHGKDKEEYAAP